MTHVSRDVDEVNERITGTVATLDDGMLGRV